jgi:hypothetical protein
MSGFDERVAAIRARARYMGVNTVDLTDLFTVEIGGQDEDVIITTETARYLHRQLTDLLGHDTEVEVDRLVDQTHRANDWIARAIPTDEDQT